MAVNYERLVHLYEARHNEGGPGRAAEAIREVFDTKAVRPREIDLGRLWTECFGWRAFDACRSNRKAPREVLLETQGAVTTAAFTNISGQFMYTTVMDAYEMEEGVFSKLIPEEQAATLDGQKIPGITRIGDEIGVRGETDPYPLAGVGEDWVQTPAILDRGLIVPITWEAVFNDKTGQLTQMASDVGSSYRINEEKRAIDCVIDENSIRHRYNWRGTVIASYGDNSGSHTWDNLLASNGLVDWTDVDAALQNFNALTDPYTGEPVPYNPVHLVATLGLQQTAMRIMNATDISFHVGGYATSGNLSQTNYANPYRGMFQLVTSRLLASRLATDTDWFLGDITKYAKAMVAEPMNVAQAPADHPDNFHRRIVAQYRVNGRKEFVVVQPRAMMKNTA